MLAWMERVHADSNAKYLKGINGSYSTGKFNIFSITSIEFSADLIAPKSVSSNNIKIAFVEDDPKVPAMSVAKAYELFTKIADLCIEKGIDLKTVGVYLENEKGRLTRFAYYYDEGTDTAIFIKNIPWQEASKFLKGAAPTLVKAASTPKTADELIDELAKIEDQMKSLKARKDKVYSKMEELPYMGESEDDLTDEGV